MSGKSPFLCCGQVLARRSCCLGIDLGQPFDTSFGPLNSIINAVLVVTDFELQTTPI
jgi:hypothetical protein